jgi:hypothetical protein
MKYIFAAIVAVACVSVTAVSALWWLDRAAVIDAAAKRNADREAAEWDKLANDCRKEVNLWDSDVASRADTKRIEFCRWMIR